MKRPRLFLIDAFGYIFRAYHARARSGAPPMRTSKGLSTEAVYIFHNMVRKLVAAHQPEYIAAVFESGPSFREHEFAAYKANRPEMPPDLAEQIPWIRTLLEGMRIRVLEYAGYEADDVIGTIARRVEAQDFEVVIVSSDKDMLQLVDAGVSMLNPAKDDLWYGPDKVREFLGVTPAQVTDLLALKGDAVDNIPGAPGIGDKGARDLIVQFGSVEAALERAGEVAKRIYRESLEKNREQILLSKRLATVDTSVPLEFSLDSVAAQQADGEALRAAYRELEFFSLLKEMEAPPAEAPVEYGALESESAVREFLASAGDSPMAVVLAPAGKDSLYPSRLGLALAPGRAVSVSLALAVPLREFLENAARPKIGHDVKALLLVLRGLGIEAQGFVRDTSLEAFLLSADPAGCSLEAAAQRYLDAKLDERPERHADLIQQLAAHLGPRLDEQNLRPLYQEIELPLIGVLAAMERTGVLLDTAQLALLAADLEAEIARLAARICELAGKAFNLNSPQQLGKVLFEDLGLPAPVRYGKGKTISTAADVLEELAPDYEIVRQILEYRQVSKLKNTYVDALPALINPATGRLHTTFNQAGAATGRLSSSNPNLQNIPIRTEQGRAIRAAFIPRRGWKLLSADYSQIELRLLAHMSGDPVLMEAFRNGEDIHTRTAAEVFGVHPSLVTPEMRRGAKAVNFGIVYGQTSFGLAGQLGISRKEAETYIRNYFERYAGVKKFIDATIAEVRQTGCVRTLYGRIRPIPEINSRNPSARSFAERTAVNTPLQGTAADLIKLAMIRMHEALRSGGFRAAMLLQVHDELLFETPPEEAGPLAGLVKEIMEGVRSLSVPLAVETGVGDNWRDVK